MCRFQCKNVSCLSNNRYQCKSETSENNNDNGQPSKPPNFERNPNVNFFSLDSSDDSDTEEYYYNNNHANNIESQLPIPYSASTVVSECENEKASSAEDIEEENTGKMQNDSDSGFCSDESSSSSSGSLESGTTVSSTPTVPLKSILRTPYNKPVTVLRNDNNNKVPNRVSFADRWGQQLAQYREIPARDTTVDTMLMTELVELDEVVYWDYNGGDRRLNRGQHLKFRISLEEVSEEGPAKDY